MTYTLTDSAGGLFAIDTEQQAFGDGGRRARRGDRDEPRHRRSTATSLRTFTTSAARSFTITVTDVNDNAVGALTDADAAADTVAEDATVGTVGGRDGFWRRMPTRATA